MMYATSGPLVSLEQLEITFQTNGEPFTAVSDVELAVPSGSFQSLVGPSGCGKTTLLNALAGLIMPTRGRLVYLPGRERIETAYVFQSPRLLPWLTVRENIEFALKGRGVPSGQWPAKVRKNLELVALGEFAAQYPLRLSGGMQQRVGIARALAVEPELLLMDEPFSHLDEITARSLRLETSRICAERQVSVLFVTHDLLEALYMSDKVHVMVSAPGRIVESIDVGLERPRSYADPRLYELQADISAKFHRLFGGNDAGR